MANSTTVDMPSDGQYPISIPTSSIDATFSTTATNLTTTALNASILACSDEYFAPAINLLNPSPPVRKPGVYVHTGAWYDGWETRRHNPQPFDWVVVKLGCVAIVDGVEIDTAHFNGNEAPAVSLEGSYSEEDTLREGQQNESGVELDRWQEILPISPCGPNQRQAWRVAGHGSSRNTSSSGRTGGQRGYTHLRLKMYPDGGIARLKVYGHALPPPCLALSSKQAQAMLTDPNSLEQEQKDSPREFVEEISAALNGGTAIACSDQHFGHMSNLLLPGRGKDMGDGWETARSRQKDHVDWVICRLGLPAHAGAVDHIVVDTKDFRGNFPQRIKVEGWFTPRVKIGRDEDDDENGYDLRKIPSLRESQNPPADSPSWTDILGGERSCQPDTEHVFSDMDFAEPRSSPSSSELTPEQERALQQELRQQMQLQLQPQLLRARQRETLPNGLSLIPSDLPWILTHVKLTIIPDGGVKRLRVFGTRA